MSCAPYCKLRADADGVREDDAADLAREVVELARNEGAPVILHLLPGGGVSLSIVAKGERVFTKLLENATLSLVGVYTGMANVDDVRDDILAMPRGWEDIA